MRQFLLVAILAAYGSQFGAFAKPPNIISIIGDDLGFYDFSGMSKRVTSPNLDRLFAKGVRLNHHYAYKYCSPSRRSFVTGRWPLHLGELNQLEDGIDLRMSTLAQKLSGLGYTNYLIGKTHWGVKTARHLPINRGWDYHMGYLGGGESYSTGHECYGGDGQVNCNNYTEQLDMWHNNHPAEKKFIGQYSTDMFTQLTIDVIKNHSAVNDVDQGVRSRPFWIHLNYQADHNPLTSPPGWPKMDNDGNQVLLQVIERMDQGIGNITDALKDSNFWKNTLMIFMGDNGGTGFSNNYPLRGSKYHAFEGGMRVASGIAGGADILPKKLAGTTFNGLLHISDWFPTLCFLAGGSDTYCRDDPPAGSGSSTKDWFWPVDGFNVWPFITAGGADPRTGRPLVLSSPGFAGESSGPPGGAMIMGKYKIIYEHEQTGWDNLPISGKNSPSIPGNSTCVDGTKDKYCKICTMAMPCLYDVWADESEVHNLAEAMPEMVQLMNKSYVELWQHKRVPIPLNFTKDNDWECGDSSGQNCTGRYGCYTGPACWCTHKTDDCNVGA